MNSPRQVPGLRAAGGVLWRPSRKHGFRVAVIHRPRYDDWSLPKGKAEPGESPVVTASRELFEETGYTTALGRRLGSVSYRVSAGTKTVDFFAARALRGDFAPNKEVDRLEWLPVSAARKRMSYDFDRQTLSRFTILSVETSTVILVRHARAGHRESFDGPDDSRPLDGKGRRQAAALATELSVFAPILAVSAPLVRCTATVAPLAERLGLTVALDPDLAEENYRDDPGAARRKVLLLAHPDAAAPGCAGEAAEAETTSGESPRRCQGAGSVVASSQGGVIPGVLKTLAAQANLRIPEHSTAKASFWC